MIYSPGYSPDIFCPYVSFFVFVSRLSTLSSLQQEARKNMATVITREHLQIISTLIFFTSDVQYAQNCR